MSRFFWPDVRSFALGGTSGPGNGEALPFGDTRRDLTFGFPGLVTALALGVRERSVNDLLMGRK